MADDDLPIIEYDPRWPSRFAEEAHRIRRLIGDPSVEIEHQGSTAVPGLAAKPVIDMLVAVPSIEIAEQYAAALVADGYEHVEHRYRESWPERIVLIRREGSTRACHVHLMLRHHRNWSCLLAFRDYLRTHPDADDDYATLKRSLATGLGDDRHANMTAKSDFIARIADTALRDGLTAPCRLPRP